MIQLFFWKSIFSQVILSCERQTDCLQGNYCGINNLCYPCSQITSAHCDSINGCCNIEFMTQCPVSSYRCLKKQREVPPYGLHLFVIFFFILSCFYFTVGCYCNRCIDNKRGWDVLPNKDSWRSLFSLVEDGMYFTYSKIRRGLQNRGYISIQN